MQEPASQNNAEGDVIRTVAGMAAFSREEWDGLTETSRKESGGRYNPFISHAFLSSLEESGSVSREAGWLPQHLRLETSEGVLAGAVPCYVKSHSQGEYVFDHGWADAFERAGGHYYPKLQVCVPFTPATGPRLLVSKDGTTNTLRSTLGEGLKLVSERLGVSSVHVTFAMEDEVRLLEGLGYLHRTDQQFHFTNDGFDTYDDFLGTLSSRKRKALKKERRTALENGITIEWLTGTDLTEDVWDDFYHFYMDTGSRKWGMPYLTRAFFSLIGERMADDILMVVAKRNGRRIAGALNFIGSDAVFGRNWGCIEHHPMLHFEVCYHQAIDFAIAKGLKTVEAGAQGQHKLARGYMPVLTHSAHHIVHPGLRRAVADYLGHERAEISQFSEILKQRGPFRKPG